ncbi:MAG TPA: hypothetical protein VF865_07835 [Acidobacteriaceae bacterium]
MPFRHASRRTFLFSVTLSLAVLAWAIPTQVRAQDADNPKPEQHGRKYKAPPETSHIEVTVLKGFNKKPIDGAHVIFHPVKDGHDEGNLEVKTHQDGKVSIDVIPTGSSVRIQVLADGFSTYAEDYLVTEPSREIVISMVRPRAQISTYVDNHDKESERAPGVQEPIRPKRTTSAKPSTTPSTTPDSSSTGSKPQQ